MISREILTESSSTPSRISSQRSSPELDSRLWSAISGVDFLPPGGCTGKMTSLTGWPAPTPATPREGWSKRSIPPMGPSETTLTDPVSSSPRP